MKRGIAKEIAERITNEDLFEMFRNAKKTISDWSVSSIVNKSLSKGCAWNILASDFDVNKNYALIAKINMVREFGEYLPPHLQPVPKPKRVISNVTHQEPNFENYDK